MLRKIFIISTLVFSAGQSAFAAQARSLPPDVMKARAAEPRFNREILSFTLPSGLGITATVMVPGPRKLEEQKLPVLLIFGGFEEAANVLDLLDPQIPAIISSFDYPFKPPRRFEFPESLAYLPRAKTAIHETIAGIEELVTQLKKRSDVDPNRITIVGASFGAPFALAAAASDPEISGVVLVHGFGDIPGTATELLKRKWKPYLGFVAQPLAWMLTYGTWLYFETPSPEDYMKKLLPSQHLLLISAENDTRLPQKAVSSLWDSAKKARAEHEQIVVAGDHLDPGGDKPIKEITGLITEWLKKTELR